MNICNTNTENSNNAIIKSILHASYQKVAKITGFSDAVTITPLKLPTAVTRTTSTWQILQKDN